MISSLVVISFRVFEIGLGDAQDSVGGTHSSRFLEERTAEEDGDMFG
jgi:hypothetical protein